MSLYQNLQALQHIPNAHALWADYRSAMTSYIIAHTDADSSLAVFGAGDCNDLDLNLLISHFSSITLIDIDKEAMVNALDRCRLSDYPGIKMQACDLVGISPSAYEDYGNALIEQIHLFGSAMDFELLSSTALALLHQIYRSAETHKSVFGKDCFDYSAAFGLHSQLNNMTAWIWNAVCASLGADDTAVTSYIASQNAPIVRKVNDTILHATRKAALFSNELESTAAKGPVAGAVECIIDIRERYSSCETFVTAWPFQPASNQTYQMLVQKVNLMR